MLNKPRNILGTIGTFKKSIPKIRGGSKVGRNAAQCLPRQTYKRLGQSHLLGFRRRGHAAINHIRGAAPRRGLSLIKRKFTAPDDMAKAHAQAMAAHESPRTTKLYDRAGDEITLDEVERITI